MWCDYIDQHTEQSMFLLVYYECRKKLLNKNVGEGFVYGFILKIAKRR